MGKKRGFSLFMALVLSASMFMSDLPGMIVNATGTVSQNATVQEQDDVTEIDVDQDIAVGDNLKLSVGIKENQGDSDYKPVDKIQNIQEGDEILISFELDMADGNKPNPYVFEVPLTPSSNVSIPDTTSPYSIISSSTRRTIGTAEVRDNKIMVRITDETFLNTEITRVASGSISGTVKNTSGPVESGDKVPFKIGTIVDTTLIWDNGEPVSNLNVWKYADGSVKYDPAKNQYTQDFKVAVEAQNGKCTIDSILDQMGDYLSLDGKYKVSSSTVSGVSIGTEYADISELNGTVLNKGEKLELIYTTTVSAEAVNKNSNDKIKNKVQGTWTNNKKVSGKTFNTEASAEVTVPDVSKSLVSGATDDEQTWTITINLGDYAKTGKTLADYLGADGYVQDLPQTGLEGLSTDVGQTYKTLRVSDFTDNGNGIYTYTYKTKVTDDYKHLESTTVKNKVKVHTTSNGDLSNESGYETTGVPGAEMQKEYIANSYDISTGIMKWKVTLQNVSKNAKAVYVEEKPAQADAWRVEQMTGIKTTGKTVARNSLTLSKTVKVNGVTVIDADGNITTAGRSIISDKDQWNNSLDYKKSVEKIMFLNSFIQSNNGSDIEIEYETVIKDLTASRADVLYYNEAQLNYTDFNGNNKYVEDGDTFEDTDATAISGNVEKRGVANDETTTIDYKIKVPLSAIDTSKANEDFLVTDKMPAGLKLVTGSVDVIDYISSYNNILPFTSKDSNVKNVYYIPSTGGYNWSKSESGAYNLADRTSSVSVSQSGNQLTFRVKNTSWKDIAELVKAVGWYENPFFEITYTAEVTDKAAFNKAGKSQTYTNVAQGSYSGISVGEEV